VTLTFRAELKQLINQSINRFINQYILLYTEDRPLHDLAARETALRYLFNGIVYPVVAPMVKLLAACPPVYAAYEVMGSKPGADKLIDSGFHPFEVSKKMSS